MATTTESEQQVANMQLPRRGNGMAQTVDSTGRAIDLRLLNWNGRKFNAVQREQLFVSLLNESATTTIYFYASPTNTVDIDETAVIAAGGTPALTNSHPFALLPLQRYDYTLHRDKDLFLIVKTTAATATLRLMASSDSTSTV